MTEQLRQKKENLEQWMADHVKEGICIAFSAGCGQQPSAENGL